MSPLVIKRPFFTVKISWKHLGEVAGFDNLIKKNVEFFFPNREKVGFIKIVDMLIDQIRKRDLSLSIISDNGVKNHCMLAKGHWLTRRKLISVDQWITVTFDIK